MPHTREIFLDHASTTPVHPQVLGLMLPFFGNHYALPSSPFSAGEKPRTALAEARSRVASLIGAQASEIIFTASGTEANNLAIMGTAAAAREARRHVIVSAIEHASVLNTALHLKDTGFQATVLPVVAGGLVDPAMVEGSIRDDTALVSVMHAGNETGVIQAVEAIGRIARERGVIFHCDCVQSAGRIPVDVNAMNVDLLCLSSHKIYGPKGAGALYVREGTPVSPVLFGSPKERGLRPGALNMPAVVGFGKACEAALVDLESHASHVAGLRDLLEQEMTARIPGLIVNGSAVPRVPHLSSISFEGVLADSLAAWLDLEGITVSPRASLFSRRPSHALAALDLPAGLAFGTVRFSPGWENTADEMRQAAEAVGHAVTRIREFALLVQDDTVCIITIASRNHVRRSLKAMDAAGIPCAVTSRPIELDHLSGPRTALAVPCPKQDEAARILRVHKIGVTGMNRLKGMCRQRGAEEVRFWNKAADIKRDNRRN
ncbi:MAG: cysteine desulfurase [Desulfobacterota bacterium]|nr:cysteine desulfurase [Thermodesulfobacteriota bacterium]